MRHSVLLRVGENLIYQQAPNEKPRQESSASQVEYNRALPEWEHTAKNYLIKKEDAPAFVGQLSDEQKEKLIVGLPISPSEVEVYEDGFKKYARRVGTGTISAVKTEVKPAEVVEQKAPVQKPQTQATPPVNDKRFYFEIAIDDDSGEPMIVFPFDGKGDTTEKKLLKSFVIKGMKSGVEIAQGQNGTFEISVKK